MTVPTGTFETYQSIGNREDLADTIYNIAPTDTPFMSGISRAKATGTKHEWQTDSLATAADDNFVAEGDDASTDTASPTVRVFNYCAISDKVPRVSGTEEVIDKAGRKSEMAYQVAKRAKELKRDMESILLANNKYETGSTDTARECAGVPTYVATNGIVGAGSGAVSSGTGVDAATNGTQRVLTEALLKTVLQSCWDEGGDPDCIMVGSFNKQKISGFTGNATRFKSAEDNTLKAAIDIYDSDFGELSVMPNRFQRARDCLVLQKDMWAVAYLRPFTLHDLAKTGDSERKQLLVEYTLESRNEAASGAVYDCTTS